MVGVDHQLVCLGVHLEEDVLPLTGGFVEVLGAHAAGGILAFIAVGRVVGDADGDEVVQLAQAFDGDVVGLDLVALVFVLFGGLFRHRQIDGPVQDEIANVHGDAFGDGFGVFGGELGLVGGGGDGP